MHLDGKGDLAAAELAFYSPALLLGIAVCVRQGLGQDLSWLYLVLLSALRLIGASCIMYLETQSVSSTGLVVTAAITSAAGTAPLLLVLLGTLERIHTGMRDRGLPRMVFHVIHLFSIVGLVLAVYGGVEESKFDSGSSAARTGHACTEAGSFVFFFIYLAAAGIVILTLTRRNAVPGSEENLVLTDVAVLPFLFVRVVYVLCVSFAHPGSQFYFEDVSVWVQAFMLFLMEAVTIVLFVWAGLVTPRRVRVHQPVPGYEVKDIRIPGV